MPNKATLAVEWCTSFGLPEQCATFHTVFLSVYLSFFLLAFWVPRCLCENADDFFSTKSCIYKCSKITVYLLCKYKSLVYFIYYKSLNFPLRKKKSELFFFFFQTLFKILVINCLNNLLEIQNCFTNHNTGDENKQRIIW